MATKTYKKFLTGAATAAMVVSAVAPVAAQGQETANTKAFSDVGPNDYFMEITEANELGFVSGYTGGPNAGKFLPYAKITRGDVVKILAKYVLQTKEMTLSEYAEEYDLASVEGFSDLPDNFADAELVNFSKVVKNEGIFVGSNNNLMHTTNIQRQQIASVLVRAFKLQDKEGTPNLTDLDKAFASHAKSVEIFAENGVTNQTTFRPTEDANRGQFTSFLMRAFKVAEGLDPELPISPIESVNALNDITIKVGQTPSLPATVGVTYENGSTGTAAVEWDTSNLDNTKADTYTLTGDVEGTDLTAAVKVIVESDELGDVTEAEVTTGVIDDDMEEQYIQFTVNNKTVSIEELTKVHGYDVEFQADMDVFEDSSENDFTSETGEIDAGKVEINDSFNVKLVLKKDGEVIQSPETTVKVVNLNATPEIGALAYLLPNDEELNSNILVVGETYDNDGVYSTTGAKIDLSGNVVFTTDNAAVATVDPANGTITPVAPGKVTITATAGNETFNATFEVKNTPRVLGSVTTLPASLHIAPGVNATTAGEDATVYLTLKDQYGDPIDLADTTLTTDSSEGIEVGEITEVDTGVATVTVNAEAGTTAGNYFAYFYDEDENLVGRISVNVSAANTPVAFKLEPADPRDDSTIATKETLDLRVNQYTKDGSFAGVADDTTYTVVSANEDVATVDSESVSDGEVTVTGQSAGTTDIELKNDKGQTLATYKVTVTASPVYIESIEWKNAPTVIAAGQEVGVEDVLNIISVDKDDIVEGINLNITTSAYVRITEDGTEVYLDRDDDGSQDDNEPTLGTLELVTNPQAKFFGEEGESLRPAYTTAQGDSGQLIFRVLRGEGTPVNVLGSTTVNVQVPGAPANTPAQLDVVDPS